MLDQLGKVLFPNDVEVLEIVPQHQYVYPIFKNGSSSLLKSGYRTISCQELKNLKNIEIFVRNPYERFLSGVQTYIDKLGPACDRDTVLTIINQNLYLNRHFCPQLYWILNLKRFTSASLTIRPLAELASITEYKENQSIKNLSIANAFNSNSKILFYNEMDEVLTVNHIGKTVTFEEILNTLKTNYSELYYDIFGTARDIINALP